MHVLLQTLIAVSIVSLVSLIGIFFFVSKKFFNKMLFYLVSFAAGSLLGAAFFDLLPEALESGFNKLIPFFILIGILSFFIIEKFLHWHHHHAEENEMHAFTYLSLVGDAFHNFIDGAVIAISFLNSTMLGIVTTIAIIAHEIPQEISDSAVLVYGGFSKSKALAYNFLIALTSFVGALAALAFSGFIKASSAYLISIAIGSFIYVASTDLIPEIHKEKELRKSFFQLAFLVLGILLIYAVGAVFE